LDYVLSLISVSTIGSSRGRLPISKLPNPSMYCNPSEPSYIDKFNQAGLKAEGTNNDVNAGIQEVRKLLVVRDNRPRLLVDPRCANTISEFEQYQWLEGRDGLTDKPLKAVDHTMDALRYMVLAMAMPRPKKPLSASTRRAV
jgi:phage terminase large subunit